MKRREALRNTALFLGYAVSATTVTAVLNGCTNDNTTASSAAKAISGPEYFSKDEFALLSELTETILPETTTPGAKAVGVPEYIDAMLSGYYNTIDQQRFREGLQAIDQQSVDETGSRFLDLDPEQRTEFLTAVDAAAMTELKSGGFRPWFATLKELTWVGFFTSEIIGEDYLAYDPIPGAYDGCIPIEESGGKVWSL